LATMSPPMIGLVVIGHKDHGKSTLIGRLLYDSAAIPLQKMQEVEDELRRAGDEGFRFAFLLDTLEEERRGGLTIDIMQTPFKTEKHLYTIIDCPGHREFIKKMLTGASQADVAMLVVSAREGIGDQTRQHAFLAKALGIRQLIVAVNKMDQVGYEEGAFVDISRRLAEVLRPLGLEDAPLVPISALKGDNVLRRSRNMGWYEGPTLLDALDNMAEPRHSYADKPLRGCVQDVYERENDMVIICKIETGVLETGRDICLSPSGLRGSVEAMDLGGTPSDRAHPGDSVGLVMRGHHPRGIRRGEVISYPETRARGARSFVAEVILFAGENEVRNGDTCLIRCGTAERMCRVEEILNEIDAIKLTVSALSPDALAGGSVGEVKFSPLEPLCLETFAEIPPLGRFVIEGRRGAIGAGLVLEVDYDGQSK
jgi:elongation factor 1-alpha